MSPAAIDSLRSTLRAAAQELHQLREDLGAKLSEINETLEALDCEEVAILYGTLAEEFTELCDTLQELADDGSTASEMLESFDLECGV